MFRILTRTEMSSWDWRTYRRGLTDSCLGHTAGFAWHASADVEDSRSRFPDWVLCCIVYLEEGWFKLKNKL